MTFTEAAEAVLRKLGKPLHYKKITQLAIEQNLLSHVGKTPEVTMSTRLATLAKKDKGEAAIVRVKPGIFGLRDWGAVAAVEADDAGDEAVDEAAVVAVPVAAAAVVEAAEPDEDAVPSSPEEKERAQLLAAGAQVFPEEEDDDEPVFGEKPGVPGADAGKRRRRRRRRGGRADRPEGTAGAAAPAEGAEGAPPATAAEAADDEGDELAPGGEEAASESTLAGDEEAAPSGAEGEPVVAAEAGAEESGEPAPAREPRREGRRDDRRGGGEGRDDRRGGGGGGAEERRADDRRDDRRGGGEDRRPDERRAITADEGLAETGRDAADLLVSLLTRRDDRQPMPIRALVDDALRAGKLSGDPMLLAPAVSAAARADALRREARGERPRLRVANGRIGLVDWALGPDLVRAEADALVALERLRDGARRLLIRRLNELPQAAFTEMLVLLLERIGISSLRTTRRPGLPQGELHLAGVARRAHEELRVAVLIKRGGEVGRERVIELRGSLHHYGPAMAAWVITTGNVLSGARDEAAQTGTPAVTLIDGNALGRLMDEHGVGVRHAAVNIPYLDFDLFDALRG